MIPSDHVQRITANEVRHLLYTANNQSTYEIGKGETKDYVDSFKSYIIDTGVDLLRTRGDLVSFCADGADSEISRKL